MRTLTLFDTDGTIASILEIPDHATPEQANAIGGAASSLCAARAWSITYDGFGIPNLPGDSLTLRPCHEGAHLSLYCRCLSGGTCDVSHDPRGCACRACVVTVATVEIQRGFDVHAGTPIVRGIVWDADSRDSFPLSQGRPERPSLTCVACGAPVASMWDACVCQSVLESSHA